MAKSEYVPVESDNLHQKLSYLTEECGEVLAAVGKSLRHGIGSVNPELAPEEQESNRDWVLRELTDLDRAIKLVRAHLKSGRS